MVRGHFAEAPPDIITAPLVLSIPADACGTLQNGQEVQGKIVLIERGTCFFTIKCGRAFRAGAKAVMIINNVGGDAIIMGKGDDTNIGVPSYMISREDGVACVCACCGACAA